MLRAILLALLTIPTPTFATGTPNAAVMAQQQQQAPQQTPRRNCERAQEGIS